MVIWLVASDDRFIFLAMLITTNALSFEYFLHNLRLWIVNNIRPNCV